MQIQKDILRLVLTSITDANSIVIFPRRRRP